MAGRASCSGGSAVFSKWEIGAVVAALGLLSALGKTRPSFTDVVWGPARTRALTLPRPSPASGRGVCRLG